MTVRFCDRYIDKRSRTHDQMVQAARSGVQNIAEGSQASGTSRKSELKLTNVARASLEELKLDYEDFLRQREYAFWERSDPRRQNLIDSRPKSADDVSRWVKGMSGQGGLSGRGGQPPIPETASSTTSTVSTSSTEECAANAVLVLLAVVCPLLDRQLKAQSDNFEHEGGFTERLYKRRVAKRDINE